MPLLSAVVVIVPTMLEPRNTVRVTLELGSAVPTIVGVESFSSEAIAKEEGAPGPVVSIVMESEEDFDETLPAASVAVAFIEYVPSSRAVERVKEKLPLLSAVVVPNKEEPIKRVTFELASALPVIVGVESFVSDIFVREVGASGDVVSIVMERESDSDETLPAASVAVAFIEYEPSARAEEGVKEKAPLLLAVVLPVV